MLKSKSHNTKTTNNNRQLHRPHPKSIHTPSPKHISTKLQKSRRHQRPAFTHHQIDQNTLTKNNSPSFHQSRSLSTHSIRRGHSTIIPQLHSRYPFSPTQTKPTPHAKPTNTFIKNSKHFISSPFHQLQSIRRFAVKPPEPPQDLPFDPNLKNVFDPRDMEDAKKYEDLDDLVNQSSQRQNQSSDPSGPYNQFKRPSPSERFDPVLDHTLPNQKSNNPAKWSFPPDARPPEGWKKYDAEDGTWWRREDEESDHEPYFDPEPDQSTIPPPQSRRVDRRKRYYTYMHRNPVQHDFYGPREASYWSQFLWFWTNRILDKWDTAIRFIIHAIRPVWILSKIMLRIPEFTIKFLLQIKVEVFRYIERRWGAPEKRDPDVYKFIPGMLEATFNATRSISTYIERWGVRDPDVGAWLQKYHVLTFNTYIADKAIEKLESLKAKQYQRYLDRKKAKQQQAQNSGTSAVDEKVDQWLRKHQGEPIYTLLTGQVPGDPFYGKTSKDFHKMVDELTLPSFQTFSQLKSIESQLQHNFLDIYYATDIMQLSDSSDEAPVIQFVRVGIDRIKNLHQRQKHPFKANSVFTPQLSLDQALFILFSVAAANSANDPASLNALHQLQAQMPEIAGLRLELDPKQLQTRVIRPDPKLLHQLSDEYQKANPTSSPEQYLADVLSQFHQQQHSQFLSYYSTPLTEKDH